MASLTPRQRRALDILEKQGRVLSSIGDPLQHGCAHPTTLESLVAKGLAEWDDTEPRWRFPRIVKPGANQVRKDCEAAEERERIRVRDARIGLLGSDPYALAEAVVALEEALAKIPASR